MADYYYYYYNLPTRTARKYTNGKFSPSIETNDIENDPWNSCQKMFYFQCIR